MSITVTSLDGARKVLLELEKGNWEYEIKGTENQIIIRAWKTPETEPVKAVRVRK